jgi:riboflavin biosynthesis pyrimidine reductase
LVLDELGRHDVLQVLVEGGPTTTSAFFEAGLVNHVVWYQAPAFAGAAGTLAALIEFSTPTMDVLKRGRLMDVRRIGDDIRIDVEV